MGSFATMVLAVNHLSQKSPIQMLDRVLHVRSESFLKASDQLHFSVSHIFRLPVKSVFEGFGNFPEAATGGVPQKKGVLRNFVKFTGKHLCQSLFFNKVARLRSVTLFKKRLWRRCFPVNFAKFLRTPFLQNTSRRLLLNFKNC